MTPFEYVKHHYRMPGYIQELDAQVETVNDLAELPNQGLFLDMGCGKTLCATLISLYHKLKWKNVTVVIMPPILITQWAKWLRSITPDLAVVEYRGTPKERAALTFEGADFVLVGVQIFKKDYERFTTYFCSRPYTVIADEATFLSNVSSDSHEKVYEFSLGHPQILLTGTPANKPGDAYGIMKFTAPGTYRNKRHFENMHVEDRDFYDNPKTWMDLETLYKNLQINSKRILFEDIYKDVDTPLFDTVSYDLEPAHYKLYRKLAEDELLQLPEGKIDATSANKLTHALGQIVVNHDYFSGDPKATSNALNLIEQKLDELGSGKLVVFANYRMSISAIVRKFSAAGARAINSEVTSKQKDLNLHAFMNDPQCRLLVIQFVSGGKGLDGLQHVCNHCLFVEPCQQPRDFHQAVARLKRTGQRKRVVVWMAVASKTLQVRGFKMLLENDATMNQVVRNAYDLRNLIYGE